MYLRHGLLNARTRKARLFLIIGLIALLSVVALLRPDGPLEANGEVPDTTIDVLSAEVGPFNDDLLGSNLSPWGGYWPDNRYNPLIEDMGMSIMRVGHGLKWMIDMEQFYPARGQWDWDAGGSKSFNNQIAWWKSQNMPIVYTLNDELSTAMLNQDGSLDYDEIAYAWAGHIKYLIDSGVDVQYVEIGNEVDIEPMEGIQKPPVSGSSLPANNTYINARTPPTSENEYIKLWEAVYPAIKNVAPNLKVSAYPSGQGQVTTPYFPYSYLYTQSPYKPDFFPVHIYSFAGNPGAQTVVDSTWKYSDNYHVSWDGTIISSREAFAGWGVSVPEMAITEFNYDGLGQYSTANQMWDAIYYASVIANAANSGFTMTTFWETFAGSNTDELITDIYVDPTPELKSQALAMRLFKQFKGSGRQILQNTVTSDDNANIVDWQGLPINDNFISKRVESLATKDSQGDYKLLLINKNLSTSHTVQYNLAGVTSGDVQTDIYTDRNSLLNQIPQAANTSFSNGSFNVDMPPSSIAVIDITNVVAGQDSIPPTVSITSPVGGATVSGTVNIEALASDNVGVSRVEFYVDNVPMTTDTASPYTYVWDTTVENDDVHILKVIAYDGADLSSQDEISVNVLNQLTVTGPLVSFTFDDGLKNQYTDFYPILKNRGFPGVVYINTNAIGDGAHYSLADLNDMKDNGWEISSHTSNHWANLPQNPTAFDYEGPVQAAKNWLDQNGFPSSGFASPNGINNPTVQSVVSKYHPYNRTSWGIQSLPVANPYSLASFGVDYTTLDSVKAALDQVETDKSWIIFLAHGWSAASDFQQIVQEVDNRGIPVKTVRDVITGGAESSDTIPPETTMEISSSKSPINGWYSADTAVILSTGEPGTTYYRWGTDATQTYSASFAALEGENTLYYWSVDLAGNTEAPNSALIKVDMTDPIYPIAASPSHMIGGWSNDKTITMKYGCTGDAISGVDGYSMSWSEGTTETPTQVMQIPYTPDQLETTVSPPLADGTWYFNIGARDKAGNWTQTFHLGPYNIDTAPPNTVLGAISSSAMVNGWFSAETTIALTSDEPGTTYYRWEGESTQTYSDPFIAPPGKNDIYFYSVDPADNTEAVNKETIKIDTTKPTDPTISSSSHQVGQDSNDATVDISIAGAADTPSGVDGYSVTWSEVVTATPPANVNVDESVNSMTSPELANGSWYFNLRTKDKAGNWTATVHLGPFVIDTSAPSGSILINNDDQYANNALVNLGLSSPDALWMRFGETTAALFLQSYLPYSASATFPLSSPDGEKTVYVQFKDTAGNESTPTADSIILDMTDPIDPIGASLSHMLGLWSADNTIDVRVCGASDALSGVEGYSTSWSKWVTQTPAEIVDTTDLCFSTASAPLTDGLWYFNLRTKDRAGNWTETFNLGPFMIEAGPPTTNLETTSSSAMVNGWFIAETTIALTADEPGTTYYQWEGESTQTYTGPFMALEGQNDIFFYTIDLFDKKEVIQKATIKVDTTEPTDPTISSSSHQVGKDSNDATVDISIAGATDAASGVDGYSATWSQGGTTIPLATVNLDESINFTTSPVLANGSWYFNLRTKDRAGNWTTTVYMGPFVIDVKKPQGQVSVESGADFTNSRLVTLNLTTTNDSQGFTTNAGGLSPLFAGSISPKIVEQMRFKNAGGPWSAWQGFASRKAWVLRDRDGQQRVYAQFKDRAGNLSQTAVDDIFLDRIRPKTRLVAPWISTKRSSSGEFKLNWSASDSSMGSGIDNYLIKYRHARAKNWTIWKVGTKQTSAVFKGKAGRVYHFRVKAADRAGNSGWSKVRRTIVPYNEDSLVYKKFGFKGAVKKTGSRYYRGTARYSKTKGNTVVYKFKGKSIGLISTTAKNRSKAQIFLDGKYIKTVDAHSSQARFRQIVFHHSWKKSGTHYLKIVNLATPGRRRFDVDGLGVGR